MTGVHHIAYAVYRETYNRTANGLEELGYSNTGEIDRSFMDSLYFRDPNGHLIELACYKVEPPEGHTIVEVLAKAHEIRLARGEYAIADEHLEAGEELKGVTTG